MHDISDRIGKFRHAAVFAGVFAILSSCAPQDRDDQSRRFALDNGLRVILAPDDRADKVAMLTMFEIGQRNDPVGRSGLTHLIEHVYVTAPAGETPERTVDAFARAYPDGWNAQTTPDSTIIAAVFAPDALAAELSDGAARMENLIPPREIVERERGRVLEEIETMYGGDAYLASLNCARDRLHRVEDGARAGGVAADLEDITIDEIRSWLDRHYAPSNAILTLYGKFDAAAARRLIEQHYGGLASGAPPPAPQRVKAPVMRPLGRAHPNSRAAPSASVLMMTAFEPPRRDSPDWPAFLVAVEALMDHMPRMVDGRPALFMPFMLDASTAGFVLPVELGAGTDLEAAAEAAERKLDAALAKVRKIDGAAFKAARQRAAMNYGWMTDLSSAPRALARNNPYGAALSLAAGERAGAGNLRLRDALAALAREDVQQAAEQWFAPDLRARCVGLVPENPL